MPTVELTKENFEEFTSQGTVLIDVWAGWCGPCRRFAPVYEQAAEANPDVVFGKVDTEAEPELAASFGIQSIPTLVAFRDGIGVFMQPGALPGEVLQRLVDQIEALDMDEVRQQAAAHSH